MAPNIPISTIAPNANVQFETNAAYLGKEQYALGVGMRGAAGVNSSLSLSYNLSGIKPLSLSDKHARFSGGLGLVGNFNVEYDDVKFSLAGGANFNFDLYKAKTETTAPSTTYDPEQNLTVIAKGTKTNNQSQVMGVDVYANATLTFGSRANPTRIGVGVSADVWNKPVGIYATAQSDSEGKTFDYETGAVTSTEQEHDKTEMNNNIQKSLLLGTTFEQTFAKRGYVSVSAGYDFCQKQPAAMLTLGIKIGNTKKK